MKRLCLAVLFCMLFATSAKADLNALFIRIECNRDLGILDVQYNNIFEGAAAYEFFEKNKGIYKYNNESGKTNADVELLNGYFYEEPYQFYCELSPMQKYDLTITTNKNVDCLNDRGFIVSISRQLKQTEEEKEPVRYLVKDLPIGCDANVSRITVVPRDYRDYDDSYSYLVLEQNLEVASVFGEVEVPVSEKTLKKYKTPLVEEE